MNSDERWAAEVLGWISKETGETNVRKLVPLLRKDKRYRLYKTRYDFLNSLEWHEKAIAFLKERRKLVLYR